MSPDCTDVARSHFHSKTRALGKGDVLALEPGDLTMIAQAVGRSVSHVHRIIKRERQSPHLEMDIEQVVGWPIALMQLPMAERSKAA